MNIEALPPDVQDAIVFACVLVARSGYTFLREPKPLTKDKVYWEAHPPQPLRLRLMAEYALKFSSEMRPAVRESMAPARYRSLMDAVSSVMWTSGRHAAGWMAQTELLRSAEGSVYVEALYRELNAFRATLGRKQIS